MNGLTLNFYLLCTCVVHFNAEASQIPTQDLALTIQDAVELTIKNNTHIKIAESKVDEESAKAGSVWAALLPEVSFGYNWRRQKASVETTQALFDGNAYNRYAAVFTATQPLLRGGALWSGPIAQSAFTEQARIDAELATREAMLAMAKSYYELLLYQEQVSTLKRQYETQSKLIKQARQRFRMGAERELTVLQFETQSALLKPQIIEAENKSQSSAVQLLNLIGKSDISSIRVRGSLESVMAYKPVAAGEVDFNSRAEIKRLYQEVRGLEAAKTVFMAEHWPTVNLVGSWGNQSFTRAELFSPNNREWAYGLELKVPLFSGLSSFAKRRELAAQTASLRYREKSVRDNAAIELVQTEKTLRSSQELVAAKKIAFDLAKKSYQRASEMFRFGTLAYRDFFDIERDLIGAELSYYQSLFDHITAAMRFHVATGQDLKTFLASMGAASS